MTNLEALTEFIYSRTRHHETMTDAEFLTKYAPFICNGWMGTINQVPAGPGAGEPTCWVKDCTADATYTQEHKRADGTTEVLNFCHAHYFVVPKDMVLDQ